MQSQQQTTFRTRTPRHFFRLFPELSPLRATDAQLWALAERMVDRGCWQTPDSSSITNGWAIFSQFLAHDITFEPSSRLRGGNELPTLHNDRTLNLDLDCLYGQPTQDFYYDAKDTAKLLLGKCFSDGKHEWFDLQRNAQHKAIIPDARNDENIIVSRMQVLFIQFHNSMVDYLRRERCPSNVFEAAFREVVWHYHWLILHGYLRMMMDPEYYGRLLEKGCTYFRHPVALPVEFTAAAFRTGHSQTRDFNRINETTQKELMALGFFTEMTDYVDWRYLFDFGDGKVEYARRIDTQIGRTFHNLPFIKTKDRKERSLPFRNLRRGVAYGLPSGEDVARRLGAEVVEVLETRRIGMEGTPLWYYVLKEAEVLGKEGEHLGPVGSILLGECFLAIMQEDDWSYLKLHPRWQPALGRNLGEFDFVDLVRFVGVGELGN